MEENTVLFVTHSLGYFVSEMGFCHHLDNPGTFFQLRNPSLICLHILNVSTQYIKLFFLLTLKTFLKD